MNKHFAVDLGAESGRCVVGIIENGILTLDELCRFPTQTLFICGEYKWNVYRFYEEIVKGLKEYVKKYGNELDSIGVDTWGVDYGLIDKSNKLLGIPYSYRDNRTQGTTDLIMENRNDIYSTTGIQFLEFNTLNQLISEKKSECSQLNIANNLLFIGDLIHSFLGARPTCEYTAASISQLVDTSTKNWDDKIFETYTIPKKLMTEIVFAGDIIGTLCKEIADDVGLKGDVKIIAPAVHDTASAIVALPAENENFAYISSGTWSIAGIELDEPVKNELSLEMNISNSGGVLNKSLFLKNVMGLWLIQQCKKQWNKINEKLEYSDIIKLASNAKPFSAFIDPDNQVFFNPVDMPEAISNYIFMSGQGKVDKNDIGTISRIIYECLAFKYHYVFQKICRVVDKKIEKVHIVGGGSKNEMLNQFVANVMNVEITAGPVEGTAMGNILMQAYGCKEVSSLNEIRRIVKNSNVINEFLPTSNESWTNAYDCFVEKCKL